MSRDETTLVLNILESIIGTVRVFQDEFKTTSVRRTDISNGSSKSFSHTGLSRTFLLD